MKDFTMIPDKENVLVTGGAGYLGSTIVPMLLEKGCWVTIYDAFWWGVSPTLHFINHGNLTVIKGDIRDATPLKKAMHGQDTIIHLASVVGYPACDQDQDLAISVNIDGTRNIVDNLSAGQKLIFASTGSCYGAIHGICSEETPINPLTLYGRSKAEAEKIVLDAGGVALRLATVFGVSPRLRLDLLVNDLAYLAHTKRKITVYEGNFRRTFLHCRDAAAAFIMAMEKYSIMKGQAFNIGDDALNMTKLELAQLIARKVPGCVVIQANEGQDLDKRDYEVSYHKVQALGFYSSISVEEGIEELLKIYPALKTDEFLRSRNV